MKQFPCIILMKSQLGTGRRTYNRVWELQSWKKIYDEVTENILDMNNLRFFFEEIEKKNMGGCLYFVMSSVSWAK